MKRIKEKINESLIMSYDSNKLISKLKKYFYNIEEVYKYTSKSDIQIFSFKIDNKDFEKVYEEKLFKILDFYGYYITEITYIQNENKYVLSFEPIFGKKCNDLVYKKCNGIIYHITKNKYIKKIRSKGLIPLEGKTYRTFTERIFLSVGKTDEEIIENINLLINQISRNNDYIILRIDLNKYNYNVDFYFDPSEDDKHNFIYCNAYFPPHMIEEIDNIDDLKNKLKLDSELDEAKIYKYKIGKIIYKKHMIKVITPEETYFPYKADKNCFKDESVMKIFLAGTIDNGDSENWQDKLIEALLFYNMDDYDDIDLSEDFSLGNLIIYNPRRENWNPKATSKDIEEQIKWEQEKLDDADLIVMYLADNSKSPISLLELGLYGPQGKMIVFCTDKFYRYSNIKLTCEKYLISLINSLDIDNICNEILDVYESLK